MRNNKLLNFKHLLGFNQLETICDASDNPEAIEYMGRLANKIGGGEPMSFPPDVLEDISRLTNKIGENVQ